MNSLRRRRSECVSHLGNMSPLYTGFWRRWKDNIAVCVLREASSRREVTEENSAGNRKSFTIFLQKLFLYVPLWHMEGPRLGVKLELELQLQVCTTATQILTHWVRPGIKPSSSQWELLVLVFFFFFFLLLSFKGHTHGIWRFLG